MTIPFSMWKACENCGQEPASWVCVTIPDDFGRTAIELCSTCLATSRPDVIVAVRKVCTKEDG